MDHAIVDYAVVRMRYYAGQGANMASRRSLPKVRAAGLKRAARLAGESFGHEDLPALPMRHASLQPSLWWVAAALAAIAGLVTLSLR